MLIYKGIVFICVQQVFIVTYILSLCRCLFDYVYYTYFRYCFFWATLYISRYKYEVCNRVPEQKYTPPDNMLSNVRWPWKY